MQLVIAEMNSRLKERTDGMMARQAELRDDARKAEAENERMRTAINASIDALAQLVAAPESATARAQAFVALAKLQSFTAPTPPACG